MAEASRRLADRVPGRRGKAVIIAPDFPETQLPQNGLSPDGGEKSAAVPAGTKLTIFRTNNKDLVDLISAEGEIYRVGFDRSKDFMGEVNGVPLQEAFDGLFFAG